MKNNMFVPADIKERAIKYIDKKRDKSLKALDKAIRKGQSLQKRESIGNKIVVLLWLADLVRNSGL